MNPGLYGSYSQSLLTPFSGLGGIADPEESWKAAASESIQHSSILSLQAEFSELLRSYVLFDVLALSINKEDTRTYKVEGMMMTLLKIQCLENKDVYVTRPYLDLSLHLPVSPGQWLTCRLWR